MSKTIVAVIVQLLVLILPYMGLNLGSEEITTTVSTLVAIGTGLYIWFRRTQRGDVDNLGRIKR